MTPPITEPSGPSGAPQVAARPGRSVREGAVLACACASTILVIGFVAAINLAIPRLAASGLNPSATQLLWIVDAYVVFFACLVIPAGALGDRRGRKGVLIAGLALFAAGAMLSAAATTVPGMLLGRVLSGIGAAAVLPNALAVLLHATQPARRPHAIAVWAAMSGVGGVVGNVGGGAVLTTGSWRWLFVAVAPIALTCAAWTAVAVPRSDRHDRNLDTTAAMLLTGATLALLLGIVEGPERGWTSPVVVASFVAAGALYAGWTARGLRADHPLLDPRLFAIPALRAACLGMLVVFFGMFGFFYLNASLLQYGRGFTVLQAGLGVLPLTVPLLVASRRVPGLVARLGDRAVLGAAFAVTAAGLFGLATAIDTGYLAYAGWMVLVGCGITLALPALTIAISAALPREQAGVAGGLQATTRELGSALGVAVIGSLITSRFVPALPVRGATGTPHGATPHTVAQALAVMPAQQAPVIVAYDAAADSALKVVAIVVLLAGALVLTDMTLASRRAGRRLNGRPV